jgi:hypothetical protein
MALKTITIKYIYNGRYIILFIYHIEIDYVSSSFNLLKLWKINVINNSLMIKTNIHP